MSWFQRLVKSVVSKRFAAAMEADSRRWVLHCECGRATSVWEMGGIRYGSRSKTWTRSRCANCGRTISGWLEEIDPSTSPPSPPI